VRTGLTVHWDEKFASMLELAEAWLREPTEAPGGALVYLDALEFLATEHSLETTLRFVQWLGHQVSTTGSALLASVDPRALDLKDLSRLERAFQAVG
jgi:hypothetical protein